ncbi:hypothetical protein PR202_ga12144 [Eleusine coracana subsp. coracana]|uniref:Uncharacterized protein n=1 Tax=Eleusine coracana subsp. coracana TaxID=191504 RepID=A0AAV5CBB3_ELECO|nr:hypothetical protein PR202_ga12144 [Eleusine coracana subsp. coracana]
MGMAAEEEDQEVSNVVDLLLAEEAAASPLLASSPTARQRSRAADVHLLSAAFLFVFSAYSAAQNLESSVNSVGSLLPNWPPLPNGCAMRATWARSLWGSCTVYTSFTLFSVVASPVVARLGTKRALVAGTSGYVLFILANLVPTWYTMVPASLYLGFCAWIIWVEQGFDHTSLGHARDNNLPEVIGNLISLALLRNGKIL